MQQTTQRQLKADEILRFFLGKDDALDTAIKCNSGTFVTTDNELYHALGSLKTYDTLQHSLLVKFLEVVTIAPQSKELLTEQKVEQLRTSALRSGGTQ